MSNNIQSNIPKSTKVWDNTHIREDCTIGENCTIGEFVYIDKGVTIGNGCRIQNSAQLYNGVQIGDNVFIGPGAITTNDIYPELPVQDWTHRFKKTIIEDNVSIGANATIVCGITIGKNTMIGAGSVVTKDCLPNAVYYGNPAKFIRWKK